VVRPDQVSLGVLVTAVPRDAVDAAVLGNGVGAKRSDGKLPAHVTAYLTMAMCLFAEDDYTEVAAKVTGSLSRWRCWDAGWSVPTASGITQARCQSPRTVETWFVVMLNGVVGLVVPASWAGAGWTCPRFLLQGSRRLGGPGRAEGASRAARCEAPLRPEGRPRILRGLGKTSGGAAASIVFRPCVGGRVVVTRPAGGLGRVRSRPG
jgi:hypothetical protein